MRKYLSFLLEWRFNLERRKMIAHHTRSPFVAPGIEFLREQGLNIDDLLACSGISQQMLADKRATVPLTAVAKLYDDASQQMQCDHLGLLFGRNVNIEMLGILGLLVRSASTVGELLDDLIQYLSLNTTGMRRELNISNSGIATISTIYHSPQVNLSRQLKQFSIAFLWSVLTECSNGSWRSSGIYFSFSAPQKRSFYRDFFDSPIYFDAGFDAIAFPAADLQLKLDQGDVFLHEQMTQHASQITASNSNDLIAEVERYVRNNLEIGIKSEEELIKFFPMGKRALQIRLRRLGTSYREIVAGIRFQKAESYLLSSSLCIAEIAELLCYKSSSAFVTAFKRRYGKSPLQWQKAFK